MHAESPTIKIEIYFIKSTIILYNIQQCQNISNKKTTALPFC
jgi:hypothetical protein